MIALRPYQNGDSPRLVALWNTQPPLRGRLQPLTVGLLEQYVLSRPYFDPRGLLLAERDGQLAGWVHAGFSLTDRAGELEHHDGLICQLLLEAGSPDPAVATALIDGALGYLRERGAVQFYAGAIGFCAPFYLGLYGGSRLPGVLHDDHLFANSLRAGGFREQRPVEIWQRDLRTFRPPVDRELLAMRRQLQFRTIDEYQSTRWCERCALAWSEPTLIEAVLSRSHAEAAQMVFWDMAPLSANWGGRALGLASYSLGATEKPETVATCLLAEVVREFQTQGVATVEVQVEAEEVLLRSVVRRLEFQLVDHGSQFVL